MLDIGHLMNCDTSLRTGEGADYVPACWTGMEPLPVHQGIIFTAPPAGNMSRAHTGFFLRLPLDYLKRYGFGYRHILRIDTHQPWTSHAIREVVERIGPDYLVHELSAPDRGGAGRRLSHIQNRALGRG